MTPKARRLTARLLARLKPPEELRLSEWAESRADYDEGNIKLPPEQTARPGPYQNWPYFKEMMDAIGDSSLERVSIMKSARIGYTKVLAIGIGAYAANEPCNIMLLMPTDEDAAEISVDEIEPIFEHSPALKNKIKRGKYSGTNLRQKTFIGGGGLKIRSARAPRKLARLDIKVLYIDEADRIEITKEGDAISIAEARTLARKGRKIVAGSTPTIEGASPIERLFEQGTQEIYEVPCPSCGTFSEIQWEEIKWELDASRENVEHAWWECPHCRNQIEERWKPSMIESGRWRALRPEVKNHRSFRINALVSMLANATWPQLAALYRQAKRDGPAYIQVFRNTILGLPWRISINKVDAGTLMARAEPWGLKHSGRKEDSVPAEVLLLLAGADVQDDRIEVVLLGYALDGTKFILGHVVFEGNTLEPGVWRKLDRWHREFYFRHPNGWLLGIDAMAVDSGGREGRTQVIYDWCGERIGRMIYAIKGEDGPNKTLWRRAAKAKGGARLAILSVDQLKTRVQESCGAPLFLEGGNRNPAAYRFSDQMSEEWYEQLTNETRQIKYVDHRPVVYFKRKREGAPVEALDCTAYAEALLENPTVMLIDIKARSTRRLVPAAEAAEGEKPAAKKRRSIEDIAKDMNG